jgi:hypothetical protein
MILIFDTYAIEIDEHLLINADFMFPGAINGHRQPLVHCSRTGVCVAAVSQCLERLH